MYFITDIENFIRFVHQMHFLEDQRSKCNKKSMFQNLLLMSTKKKIHLISLEPWNMLIGKKKFTELETSCRSLLKSIHLWRYPLI